MTCAESVRVQGYFDGELDALTAVEIERHVNGCAVCKAELAALEELRTRLRAGQRDGAAPPALRRAILRMLDAEDAVRAAGTGRPAALWRLRAFWAGAASAAGALAGAAAVALLVMAPGRNDRLPEDLVADHLRALSSARLIAVASSDRHTVKPWFAAHADVSPAVADFAAEGYRLLGGRADPVLRQRAAVVVFQHGAHFIDVYAWAAPGGAVPADTTRRGYHLAFWQVADVRYCAVSDTGWDELRPLVARLRELARSQQ